MRVPSPGNVAARIVGRLFNPGIAAGVLATALLVVMAYQARPTYAIGVGTPADTSLVRNFNTPEMLQGDPPQPFRWSKDDSYITLRDVGRQDYRLTLTASGFRPGGQPPALLQVEVAGNTVVSATVPPTLTSYHFDVPREAVSDGTLLVHLHTNAFIPPGDPNPRPLGVIVTGLLVEPGTNPDRFIEPPVRVVVALVAASAMLGLLLALVGWGVGGVALGSLVPGLLGAWLIVGDRLWLTSGRWYEAWPQSVLAGGAFVGFVAAVGWLVWKQAGLRWTVAEARALLAIMLAAFVVRFAGQMHPLINIVDLGFHGHRLDTVLSGQLLFTIKSAEWGGHETFYLPTAYVFMLPLRWLIEDNFLVIKLFTVACGTLGAGAVYLILRRLLRDGRAGLAGAALYLIMPISVLPYSWGISTNIFGELFALCALAVLALSYKRLRPTSPGFWLFLLCLLMALLSHPGVVQLTGLAFGLIGVLWWLFPGRAAERVRRMVPVGAWALAALALATALSYAGYYVHFAADMLRTLGQIREERAAQAKPGGLHLLVGGSVTDRSLGLVQQYVETRRDWLLLGLQGFWREAVAYYRAWPLLGATLGFALVWPGRRGGDGRRKLVLAALGWVGAVVAFAVIGWTINLYVRYSLFALPIVALGGAVLLSRTWARGRMGAALVCLLLALFAYQALGLWQYRITYAFK